MERREAVRQGQLAQSSRMVAESDLLRETRGPELNRSLSLAVSAIRLAGEAHGSETEALRPVYKALEVFPLNVDPVTVAVAVPTLAKPPPSPAVTVLPDTTESVIVKFEDVLRTPPATLAAVLSAIVASVIVMVPPLSTPPA